MPTHRTADSETVALLAEVMKQYHPDLVEAGVRVGLLLAHAPVDRETGEVKGPALKLHGYAALAIVRIVSAKDRVAGMPDAQVTLDADAWPEHVHERKVAIFSHELTHLVLVRDEEGGVKTDDAFRPRLKMRPHDYQLGMFTSVIEKHGLYAVEAQAYVELHRAMTQTKFPWG